MKLRESKSEITFSIVNLIIITLVTLICIYPFYYILINTISANDLVDAGEVLLYPKGIHFNNYIEVLNLDNIGHAAFVSLGRTIIGSLLSVLSSSYMGYLFTKQLMWKRKLLYRLVIATMYFSAGTIPIYLNLRMLGFLNSFWVYVIPGMFPVYNMILIKTYIESLTPALEESAEIDGAGYLTRFFCIMLPLSIPIIATVTLFTAVGQWNSFMDTVLYVTQSKLFTLQFMLRQYFQQSEALANLVHEDPNMDISELLTPNAVRLTITAIVTIPILCAYPFIQRYYVNGIMVGAVKG